MKRLVALVIVALFLALPNVTYAIDNPDSISLISARSYESVIQPGDVLFVAHYNVSYTSAPVEGIDEAFILRLMDGTTEIRSTSPYVYFNGGYDEGVVSIYFTADEATDLGVTYDDVDYSLTLQGNPNIFATSSGNSVDRDVAPKDGFLVLRNDIIQVSTSVAASWASLSGDTVTFTQNPSGTTILTATGEVYYAGAIPELREMVPSLFSGGADTVEVIKREHSLSQRDELIQFWDNTSFGRARDNLATLLDVPPDMVTTFGLVGFNIFIAWILVGVTKSAEMVPLSVAFLFPVGAYIGLVDMVLTALMVALAAFGFVYILFLRRG